MYVWIVMVGMSCLALVSWYVHSRQKAKEDPTPIATRRRNGRAEHVFITFCKEGRLGDVKTTLRIDPWQRDGVIGLDGRTALECLAAMSDRTPGQESVYQYLVGTNGKKRT